MSGSIGLAVNRMNAAEVIDLAVKAEAHGVGTLWMTAGGLRDDPLTTFGGVLACTQRIGVGTAIMRTWPQHPLAVATQVIALESIGPGRVRLGVGPSNARAMQSFGVSFDAPLDHLREYVVALRQILQEGAIDVAGKTVTARGRIDDPPGTPVMASALQPQAFALCGEVADGAITWLCPLRYLEQRCYPALRQGAERVGREPPPVIVHVPVVVAEDRAAVESIIADTLMMYTRFAYYRSMFAMAGIKGDDDASMAAAMADRLVIWGDKDTVANRLRSAADAVPGELMVTPIDRSPGAVPAVVEAIQAAG